MHRRIAAVIGSFASIALLGLAGCTTDNAEQVQTAPDASSLAGITATVTPSVESLPDDMLDAAPAGPADFELGRHYSRLTPTQPTDSGPDSIEVVAVCSYESPACFELETYLAAWDDRKAGYIDFRRLPTVASDTERFYARAFFTAELLEKSQETHAALFREIHVNGNALDTPGRLADFFARFGVDPADFAAAFDSFTVHSMLERADHLNRRYRITSTPSIVVNGKYKTTPGSTSSGDEMMALIDHLARLEILGG